MNAPTTAEEILSAMAGTYSRCRSYRDIGVCTRQVFPETRPAYEAVKRFSTTFVRPQQFRFEYRYRFFPNTPENRQVVWSSGDAVHDWADWGNGETELRSWPSLREGLTVLGGVSDRLSVVVPSLLLPGWADGKRWKLSELARLEDGQIDGTACYRLQGRFSATPDRDEACEQAVREVYGPNTRFTAQISPITFWIDQERSLLRRFTESGRIMDNRFELTTDYQPELDVSISDPELAFGVG
jgi:hypothetical protein